MITKLLFIFSSLAWSMTSAQVFNMERTPHSWIIGLHSSGSGYNAVDPVTNEKAKFSNVYLEPYAAYFINECIGVGIIGGWTFVRSNFMDEIDLFEVGTFGRFFYPLRFKNHLRNVQFLSEISYRRSTYRLFSESDYLEARNLDFNIFTVVPLGLTIRLFKGINFEISSEWIVFSPDYAPLRYRIGLEYHILRRD